jgi:hypothetical protein
MEYPSKPSDSPTLALLRWLVPLLVIFLIIRTPNDNDMWWHLRAGQDMLRQHQILTHDQFSFTRAGVPWINAFWMADIVIFLVYRLGGFFALSLGAALLVAFTMVIILNHSSGPIPLRAILILIASFGISAFSAVRPQLFSFLMLALLDFELERTKRSREIRLLILVPMFILWANVHGGYFWGLLLLGAFIIGECVDHLTNSDDSLPWNFIGKLTLWGLVTGLSTALNPNGLSLWKLPFYTVQVSISTIGEWNSPDFHRLDIQPMLWLTFLLIIGLGFTSKKLAWSDAFKFLGFAFMSFISQRSIAPFLVVAVPVVSRYLASAMEELKAILPASQNDLGYRRQAPPVPPRFARFMNGVLIITLVVACLGRAYYLSRPPEVFSNYPEKAVQWIKHHKPDGPLFNSYNWGGFLTWSLPEYPVFIDGRADLYGDALLSSWWDVANGTEKGLKLIDDLKINMVLLEPGWPILNKLPARGWQVLYVDDTTVLLGR